MEVDKVKERVSRFFENRNSSVPKTRARLNHTDRAEVSGTIERAQRFFRDR